MGWATTVRAEIVFVVVGLVAMCACGSGSQSKVRNAIPATAATILDQADHFELLSLNPNQQREAAVDDFHGYGVFGMTVISDTKTREKLVSAFKNAVAE